jgi:hypothetical protein
MWLFNFKSGASEYRSTTPPFSIDINANCYISMTISTGYTFNETLVLIM